MINLIAVSEETAKKTAPKDTSIKIFDLPFYRGMFRVFEAMHYSVSDYNAITSTSSDRQKSDNESWFDKIQPLALKIKDQLVKYASENFEELQKNPLILGLINLCIAASTASSREEMKKIYDDYINFQKIYQFADHKKEYINAGCALTTPYFTHNKKLQLIYPLFLYGAYTEHGGRGDYYREGYLFPYHDLTVQELEELHEMDTDGEIFKDKDVQKLYLELTSKENC